MPKNLDIYPPYLKLASSNIFKQEFVVRARQLDSVDQLVNRDLERCTGMAWPQTAYTIVALFAAAPGLKIEYNLPLDISTYKNPSTLVV
jgi:hypothetical protein